MASQITILGVLAAISQAIVALFNYLSKRHDNKYDEHKIQEQKIENAENKIDQACNSGTISELIDATIELGETKNK